MDIQKLGHSLAQASRWQNRYIIQHLTPYRLGPRTLPFYLAVAQHEGVSQKELMGMVVTDKTQTTKALNQLEKEGYVKRVPDPKDNRINGVYLTKDGRSLVPQVKGVLDSLDNLLSEKITQKDLYQFIDLLDAFSSAVDEDLNSER